MSEPALRDDGPQRTPLHALERPADPAAALDAPAARSFLVLLCALSLAAGHGVFLVFALTQLRRIPNLAELGGPANALVVGWFALAGPLALGAYVLRRRLVAWPAGRLRAVALAALGLTALAFALYVRKMVIGA